MHSTSISTLVILALSTLSQASPTPAGAKKVPDRETAGFVVRDIEPDPFHKSTASPNPGAVMKRTLQLGCTTNHMCDEVLTRDMCFAASMQIHEDSTYRTGLE